MDERGTWPTDPVNRRRARWVVGGALLLLVVAAFLVPSLRAGGFTVTWTTVSTLAIAAITATAFALSARRRGGG